MALVRWCWAATAPTIGATAQDAVQASAPTVHRACNLHKSVKQQPTASLRPLPAASVVCKHWRAALSSHRAAYPYVTLGLAGGLDGGPEQAAQAAAADEAATQRALAVAARPPAVQCIELRVGSAESAGLVAANTQALAALLSQAVSWQGMRDAVQVWCGVVCRRPRHADCPARRSMLRPLHI